MYPVVGYRLGPGFEVTGPPDVAMGGVIDSRQLNDAEGGTVNVVFLQGGAFFADFRECRYLPDEVEHGEGVFRKMRSSVQGFVSQVTFLNAHRACLLAASIDDDWTFHQKEPLRLNDVDSPRDLNVEHLGSYVVDAEKELDWDDDWNEDDRRRISHPCVARSLGMMQRLMIAQVPGLELAELYLRGSGAIDEHDFAQAMVNGWPVVEMCAAHLDRLHESNRPIRLDEVAPNQFVGKARWRKPGKGMKNTLLRLRNNGILEEAAFAAADAARASRNAWVHELKPVDERSAEACLIVARELLHTTAGVDLNLPAYRSYKSGMS